MSFPLESILIPSIKKSKKNSVKPQARFSFDYGPIRVIVRKPGPVVRADLNTEKRCVSLPLSPHPYLADGETLENMIDGIEQHYVEMSTEIIGFFTFHITQQNYAANRIGNPYISCNRDVSNAQAYFDHKMIIHQILGCNIITTTLKKGSERLYDFRHISGLLEPRTLSLTNYVAATMNRMTHTVNTLCSYLEKNEVLISRFRKVPSQSYRRDVDKLLENLNLAH